MTQGLLQRTVLYLAIVALVLVVSADLLTFAYFYPRNAILFGEVTAVSQLADAWREWRQHS